jgi:hypothetical protein
MGKANSSEERTGQDNHKRTRRFGSTLSRREECEAFEIKTRKGKITDRDQLSKKNGIGLQQVGGLAVLWKRPLQKW